MLLGVHIILALFSVAFSSFALFKPTRSKMKLNYIFAGGTLGSGILLVLVEPATMIRACVVGIVYFIAVSVIIYQTRQKLAYQSASSDD